MPADRFYLPQPLEVDTVVSLDKEEALHMSRVMRKRKGDSVELFNGRGELAQAEVIDNDSLKVLEVARSAPIEPKIIVAQSLITPNKLDWVVEKCQELGAAELWLFPADFSEKKQVSESILKRLKTITISAAKQSGRLFLMNIVIKEPLTSWPSYNNLYYGSTEKEATLWPNISKKEDCIFIIGPEKGFSSSEKRWLERGKGVSLSPYTLRTETAALVMLSSCQFL